MGMKFLKFIEIINQRLITFSFAQRVFGLLKKEMKQLLQSLFKVL